jgi:proline iminopeptidase
MNLKKRTIHLILIILCFAFGVVLFLVLRPAAYHVPQQQARAGTKFWNLPTGSRIAYTLIPAKGEKKSNPIIFLQGGPGGPIYGRNIHILSNLADDGYDVYLYDQVGCGFSERLGNITEYTTVRHKNDLEEIVKFIGKDKVILIGQSWGAILATLFAADNPEKVEKIIFTSPGPVLPVNEELDSIRQPDSLKLRKPVFTNRQGREKAYSFRNKFIEFMAIKMDWKLVPDKEMDDFASYLNFEMGKSTVCDTSNAGQIENGAGYYCMIKTVQSFNNVVDIREKLKQCKVPVLILKGQCDNIKWGYTSEYLSLFQHHRFVLVPGAGHGIATEQPEIYLNTIRHFLTK